MEKCQRLPPKSSNNRAIDRLAREALRFVGFSFNTASNSTGVHRIPAISTRLMERLPLPLLKKEHTQPGSCSLENPMTVPTETGVEILGQAPRCANCGHLPLTLLAFAASQILRARLGCTCRSAILYTKENQPSGERQVSVEPNRPANLHRSLFEHTGSMHVQ